MPFYTPATTAVGAGTSSIVIQDDGSPVGTATTINFAGAGVAATFSGGTATATVSGGTGTFDPDVHMPRLFNFDAFQPPTDHLNFQTFSSANGSRLHNYVMQSSGAQNDYIAWDVPLSAGTWAVDLIHRRSTNVGIYSVQIDDVEKGTIDGYVTPTSDAPKFDSVTGIAIASTDLYRLKLKMANKNASSSSYFGGFSAVQIRRTA